MEEAEVRLCRTCHAISVRLPRTDLVPCRCGNVLTWDWNSYHALTRSIIDDLNEIGQILREAGGAPHQSTVYEYALTRGLTGAGNSETTSSFDPGS